MTGVINALLAAALFGASTPFAKMMLGQVQPVMMAGLLYLGSGLGLLAWFALRAMNAKGKGGGFAPLTVPDLPWFAGAILAGGVAGPLLLMTGLILVPASTASLLLNLEGALTALLAWIVFKENLDRRIFAGMGLIVTAGLLLAWQERPEFGVPWGALAIVGACLCWAIDNNLTRKVSAGDAVQIAGIKGLVAGMVNLAIALFLGAAWPAWANVVLAGLIGFLGYGASLAMFVVALRHLGAARTGAYFSAAPFVGVVVALLLFHEAPGSLFWLASGMMAAGIWLHLTERHEHAHAHPAMRHIHSHVHDEHHSHRHDFPWDGKEPHTHEHEHEPITHWHAHFPDIHHRHGH